MHFLRNALDYVSRKVGDDCLRELRWLYDRRDLAEAKRDLAAWLAKWQAIYPKLCGWIEEHIEETLTFLPAAPPAPQALEVAILLERLNEEIKRRTHLVRIFPIAESCLRPIRVRVPGRGVGVGAAGISMAGRAALVQAAAAGSMRLRSSRKGANLSRVM